MLCLKSGHEHSINNVNPSKSQENAEKMQNDQGMYCYMGLCVAFYLLYLGIKIVEKLKYTKNYLCNL